MTVPIRPHKTGACRIMLDRAVGMTTNRQQIFVLQLDGSWDLYETGVAINNVTTEHMLALIKEHVDLGKERLT